MRVIEKRPRSFTEFLGIIVDAQNRSRNSLWYRGAPDSKFQLVPSLYRHKKIYQVNDLIEMEFQMLVRVRQRSVPFIENNIQNEWDALFFMQHYGIPTRLLDWTENPFIAFYFAVMYGKSYSSKRRVNYRDDAVVWVLDPVMWNQKSLEHESYDKGILSIVDDQIKGYKPVAKYATMQSAPVALFGNHNSSRIVSQQGVFVIFGGEKKSMETIFDEKTYPNGSLIKVVLGKRYLARMRKDILNNGITEAVVYPDLEGLSKEIKRVFEFEV